MKKILFLALTVAMAGTALAEDVVLSTDNNFTVKTTDCELLNENVKINLTSNVVGAVSCNENAIAIATCHTGGRTASREVELLDCVTDAGTGVETCSSRTPKEYETQSGAAVAAANTVAGTVISKYPGTSCDAAGATATTVSAGMIGG